MNITVLGAGAGGTAVAFDCVASLPCPNALVKLADEVACLPRATLNDPLPLLASPTAVVPVPNADASAPIATVSVPVACAPSASDEVIEVIGGGDIVDAGSEVIVKQGGGLADIELCDAEDYRPLIGSDVVSANLPEDPMLRVFGVDDIVTQEYLPQRTNVVYRADGTILRVWCG